VNSNKIILDLCGGTGSWSKPYSDAGYDVRIITLPENDVCLFSPPKNVYGILAAPPCTEFSFAKHFHGKGNYTHNFVKGLEIVSACTRIILTCEQNGNLNFYSIENPRGYLRRWMGEPAISIDPWWYGDRYEKRTDLWGRFNIPERMVYEKPEGIIKFSMLKSKDIHPEYYGKLSRTERRAITPSGFAQAFFLTNQ